MTNPQNNESLLIVNDVCQEEPRLWALPLKPVCYSLVFQLVQLNASLPVCRPALNPSQDEVIENCQAEYFKSLSWNKIQQASSQFVNMLEYK